MNASPTHAEAQTDLYQRAIDCRIRLEDGPNLGVLKDENVSEYISALCAIVKHCGLTSDDIPALNSAVKVSATVERTRLAAEDDTEEGHILSDPQPFSCDSRELDWR